MRALSFVFLFTPWAFLGHDSKDFKVHQAEEWSGADEQKRLSQSPVGNRMEDRFRYFLALMRCPRYKAYSEPKSPIWLLHMATICRNVGTEDFLGMKGFEPF